MFFQSVRSRFYQLFVLLGIILLLIIAGSFVGKRAGKWEQMYYRIVQLESILSQVIAGDRDALGKEEKFSVLVNDYKQFRSFCTECHAQKTTIIEERVRLLRQLHENENMKNRVKNEVRSMLGELLAGVQYIHEHHIVTLKNLLKRNLLREEVEFSSGSMTKDSMRSAPELDIIAQAVAIQNSLTAIFSNFYSFYSIGAAQDPMTIERDFTKNMQEFYRAVNTFEDYSLDAQDGLLVEELLESGRIFEKYIVDLAHLEEREISLLGDLRNNGTAIGVAVTRVGSIIDQSRQRYKKQARLMTWGSLIIIMILIFLIYIPNREISVSMRRLIRETEKMRMDTSYQIPEVEGELEEFRILTRSLNTMADHINKNVAALHREVTVRIRDQRRLAADMERLRDILLNIGEGVIATDSEGCVFIFNDAAEEITGWKKDEALGRKLEEVYRPVDVETGKPCEIAVGRDPLMGRRVPAAVSRGFLVMPDGGRRHIAAVCSPIRSQPDAVSGVVIAFRDVGREKRREREISKRKKLESVGVLAGGIAHDFNNLLVAILGNLSLALQLLKPDREVFPLLRHAEKAALRARNLTRQLLTFSKGGEPLRKRTLLNELIRESVEYVLHGSRVSCRYHFAEGLWPADIDREQVSQVIQNLITNACQAMPGGGIIEIGCENVHHQGVDTALPLEPGPYLRITVRDHGTGIHREIIDRIFDPYFTTREEGSGLGLAVCYSIIRRHRGHLGVESQPDRGTVFTVYLPAADEYGRGDVLSQQEEPVSGSGTVLIMDDDESVCAATRQILEFFGYTVLIVNDGEEAIDCYRKRQEQGRPIDAVIMDLTIPGGMGGEEAVRGVLALDEDAVVIVASGYADNTVMANYRDYGFRGALVKPFELNELTGLIADLLQAKEKKGWGPVSSFSV